MLGFFMNAFRRHRSMIMENVSALIAIGYKPGHSSTPKNRSAPRAPLWWNRFLPFFAVPALVPPAF